jgi:hypothetical protein
MKMIVRNTGENLEVKIGEVVVHGRDISVKVDGITIKLEFCKTCFPKTGTSGKPIDIRRAYHTSNAASTPITVITVSVPKENGYTNYLVPLHGKFLIEGVYISGETSDYAH